MRDQRCLPEAAADVARPDWPTATGGRKVVARTRSRASVRFVAGTALACVLSTVGLALAPAPAGATGTSPSSAAISSAVAPPSAIATTEQQVATISAQITQQQATLDQADELYNEAQVQLDSTRAALATTSTSVASARTHLAAERARLRTDAIQAYIGDTSAAATAELFASPSSETQIRSLYSTISAGNVAADVARVEATTKALDSTQAKLLAEQRNATAQLAVQQTARQSAASAASASEATLTQVQGTLASQIAQQAAAQATAAAQAATNAPTPAAAQQAAAQASAASSVASAVGSGTAAASTAAAAASQAAGTVTITAPKPVTGGTSSGGTSPGGTSPGGASSGGPASASGASSAAGLAAVHGAMKFLGVPYVWGGASSAGLDCSGLTMMAWAQAGVRMDHSAADQYAAFRHVSMSSLQPGDLIFFAFGGPGTTIDHVVMYVGPTLDGHATPYGANTIIQAAHTGTVVSFNPLWYSGLVGAARP